MDSDKNEFEFDGKPFTDEEIEKLLDAGADRWTKDRYDRLYISPKKLGLSVSYYHTGNISYAAFDGEKISNSEGRRFLDEKIWFEVADKSVHTKNKNPYHGIGSYYEDILREAGLKFVREVLLQKE